MIYNIIQLALLYMIIEYDIQYNTASTTEGASLSSIVCLMSHGTSIHSTTYGDERYDDES